ncbi:MAG: hypothetical protein AB4911_24645 [Oscillochloridaceae bacterium umkhey_bin13]
MLLKILATATDRPLVNDLDCATCQDRLPQFLDRERATGALHATHADPAVWFHLWQCPTCAEIYHATATLLAASDAGQLALPPRSNAPQLELPHAFLRAVVAPHAAAGVAWSDAAAKQLIATETLATAQIDVYALPLDATHWQFEVQVTPSQSGYVGLALGDYACFSELIDGRSSEALLVPISVLTADEGPALRIQLEAAGDAPGLPI